LEYGSNLGRGKNELLVPAFAVFRALCPSLTICLDLDSV